VVVGSRVRTFGVEAKKATACWGEEGDCAVPRG
jgi:hypothetical protein